MIEDAGSTPFVLAMKNVMGTWPLLDSSWNASRFDFLSTYAKMSREGQGFLMAAYVSANQENPRENIIFFDESSLGLPSKKMYYRAGSDKTRKAYMSLMKNLTSLLAEDLKTKLPDDFDAQLKEIFDFESAIANVSLWDFDTLFRFCTWPNNFVSKRKNSDKKLMKKNLPKCVRFDAAFFSSPSIFPHGVHLEDIRWIIWQNKVYKIRGDDSLNWTELKVTQLKTIRRLFLPSFVVFFD